MDDWWQDFNASYTSFSSVAFRLRYDSLILFFCRLPVSGIHFQSVAFKLYSYATRIDSFEATKNVYDMTSNYIFKIFNTKLFRSLSLWMNVTCFPWGANNFGMCNAAKLYLPSNLVKLNAWFEFVVRIANAWEICCGWCLRLYDEFVDSMLIAGVKCILSKWFIYCAHCAIHYIMGLHKLLTFYVMCLCLGMSTCTWTLALALSTGNTIAQHTNCMIADKPTYNIKLSL